jgi:hypothetical protein
LWRDGRNEWVAGKEVEEKDEREGGEMETYTDEQLKRMEEDIKELTQTGCARLLRFAPSGHPYFRSDLPLNEIFQEHFKSLGGMTPEVSKFIGWEKC